MASQTGSIDLTASNSVKLAAEAGWQSDLDGYYTKSEIDVTVGGIESDVTEIVDGLTQSSHFTQTATGFSFTLDDALEDAEKVATNYVTDITGGGVMIHPSDDATTGVQITSDVDIMRDGTSVINIGNNDAVRIGVDDSTHVKMFLESDAMSIDNEVDSEIFSVKTNSTGTTTVTVVAEVMTWATRTDVTTAPNTVSDGSAAAGDAIVTATVAGTDYTLNSTYATTTVTAGTGVSVALTSSGVNYVRSLMSDADVTTGTLSVEYQRTVADSAQLAFNGNQVVTGVGRAMRLHNNQWSSASQTETFYVAENESTGAAVMLGVGSGGYNRGVFDALTGTWLIYRNQSAQTVISGSNFAVYANGGIRTRGGGNSDFSGRIVAQQRIESRNSLGNVALEAANSGNKGIWDTTDSLWIICRTSDGNIVINGDNFSVASSGNITAGPIITAAGTESDIALYSANSGNIGLRDTTNSRWIIYRHPDYGIVLGDGVTDGLYHRESTCTVTSANATIYNNYNFCWNNGACCTVQLCVNLKSNLANASMVDVATAPAGYRPPHVVFGSVMVTGQHINLQAEILGDGTIRVNNRSGTTVTSSANIYMSFTFAP